MDDFLEKKRLRALEVDICGRIRGAKWHACMRPAATALAGIADEMVADQGYLQDVLDKTLA
ncbi:MAG: hypothetical protein ABSH41_26970 [Syntrophobacteraceae bacterium]